MKRKIICLCGSSRFKDEFLEWQRKLSLSGFCVLSLAFFSQADNFILMDYQLQMIKDIHFQKIEMSDAIFVINKDGYIGESTREEIEFAKLLGKKIMFMETKDHEVFLPQRC